MLKATMTDEIVIAVKTQGHTCRAEELAGELRLNAARVTFIAQGYP